MFKMLVVDDENLIRYSLSMTFRDTDIPVRTASNGEEALRAIREDRFDICFLDLQLPDMGGVDVLKVLSSESPCTKVIVMSGDLTGDLMSQEMREALRKHAVWFMEKPFSLEHAKSIVNMIVSRFANGTDRDVSGSLPRMSTLDRRRNIRRETDKLIVYTAMAPEGGNKVFNVEATLKDVSDSGLGLVTNHPIEPGWFMTFFDGETINQGIVRWKSAAHTDGAYRVGVQFTMLQ
jgi:CheY-like chemotaxis protein